MNLAQRAYVLIVLTAVLAIAGIWSGESDLSWLWRIPAVLLLGGVAFEAFFMSRTSVEAGVEAAPRAFLGRPYSAVLTFANSGLRPAVIQYVPLLPGGFEPVTGLRTVTVPPKAVGRDGVTLLPVRLGKQAWPAMPARVLGPLGFVWWTREFHPESSVAIAPDTAQSARGRPRGNPTGARSRRTVGAGSELHQLREYAPGDPLSRIDWKATARSRQLVTREFSEDQHLDILIAVDASRLSRVRAGRLDRLGLYANIVARFAEVATPNDDRVGMLVYSDRALAVCPPERGLSAVMRVRRALETLSPDSAEPNVTAAAVRIRRMLRHRSLVVILSDLDDPSIGDQLIRSVQLLAPPHLVVVAGVHNAEIADLARREARNWSDPWVSLAAQEHEARVAARRMLLRRLGAPVVAEREELLEGAVLAEYEQLRRTRRV